ncbi:hypothetical protein HDU83_006676 [Entophlyctis luteolus]|nr:hypothetical protein HDU82_009071 [Entophlyctis luteolus]KAJ3341339.1 hypothetical protein HDU83_006676 [Entophlyctis luteolus]
MYALRRRARLHADHPPPTTAGAHRVHIALAELGLPYDEVIIDLDVPRTAEYLAINPRGLVPAIKWDGRVLTESAIVAQFLADAHPSHLLPASTAPDGPLRRAQIAFFVDTFFSKFQSHLFKIYSARTDDAIEAAVATAVAGAVKEVEPLLSDAAPFFGGSARLTLAEVLTASFGIRLVTLAEAGVYPPSLLESIRTQTPKLYAWLKAVSQHPSVTGIYDAEAIVAGAKKRIAKLREE